MGTWSTPAKIVGEDGEPGERLLCGIPVCQNITQTSSGWQDSLLLLAHRVPVDEVDSPRLVQGLSTCISQETRQGDKGDNGDRPTLRSYSASRERLV